MLALVLQDAARATSLLSGQKSERTHQPSEHTTPPSHMSFEHQPSPELVDHRAWLAQLYAQQDTTPSASPATSSKRSADHLPWAPTGWALPEASMEGHIDEMSLLSLDEDGPVYRSFCDVEFFDDAGAIFDPDAQPVYRSIELGDSAQAEKQEEPWSRSRPECMPPLLKRQRADSMLR